MNYVPVVAGNQTNGITGTRKNIVTGQAEKKTKPEQEYIIIPICITDPLISQDPKASEEDAEEKPTEMDEMSSYKECGGKSGHKKFSLSKNAFTLPPVSNCDTNDELGNFLVMLMLMKIWVAEVYLKHLIKITMNVSHIPTTRIDKDHPKDQIIGDFNSAIQTRRMTKIFDEHAMMSSIEELTFFLGLQVQQKKDGIFISQDKYVADILKKFDFATVKTASTPMEPNKALIKDEEADSVDVHLYRSMIGSLMYLTTSRQDIIFVVCACARDSPFDLEAFSNSDYARASLDRKSTTRGCQFLGKRLISWQCKKQTIVENSTTEAEYVVADETVYKKWEDIVERAATTASSLDAEKYSSNINRTQSMATLNESNP
ncbi:putative ribonuclease H-like domain-containing protein [Tanacetum coccineum]